MTLINYTHGSRNENKIALTFDDGPNPYWTIKVLNLLDEYDVKACFFALGKWAEKYPEIVKEVQRRGHTVGNHSYSHPKEGNGDFELAEKIISNITDERSKFIRPPHNNMGVCINNELAKSGDIKIINNDIIPHDWESNKDHIIEFVLKNTKNGSIILLHDGSQREEELENRPSEMFQALPIIIKELKNKFEFVRLEDLNLN